MRHHTLPSEEGWSLSISSRLSGRDSSFKEHLRMLLQALWRPPRLFVLFLVALPFATWVVGFLHVLLVFLDLPMQLLLIAMDLGQVPSCWSMVNTKEIESLSKGMEWQKQNWEIAQTTTSQCIHHSAGNAHNGLFNTRELRVAHPSLVIHLVLLCPTDLISVHQESSKKTKKGKRRQRGRCHLSRCTRGTGIFSTDYYLPHARPMAQPCLLSQSAKLHFLPTGRTEWAHWI